MKTKLYGIMDTLLKNIDTAKENSGDPEVNIILDQCEIVINEFKKCIGTLNLIANHDGKNKNDHSEWTEAAAFAVCQNGASKSLHLTLENLKNIEEINID